MEYQDTEEAAPAGDEMSPIIEEVSGEEEQALPQDTLGDIEYISREGFAKLKAELETLRTRERIRIAERLEYAKSLGDLSENAEFDAAKEEQMLNEMRIGELERLLNRAFIMEKKGPATAVGIGCVLSVGRGNAADTIESYTIVGSSEEADPLQGCISHESPLGHAFFGRMKGEKVVVNTPRGEIEYVILEIA